MKSALAIALSIQVGSSAFGADPSVTVKAQELIQQEFKFDPAKVEVPEPEAEPEDEVVTMPAMTVSAALQRRDLEKKIQEQERLLETRTFSFIRGGTVLERELGPTKIELGSWAVGSNLGLLRISW
ncbi:hypothetical protein [Actomonas aquatica]|uniref:Uncharacterized protein n=1 Tax=Actomonas aquatica TaxID=2866162 RepID=A0ABZ1CDX4_9BACT|nr:hypothetical protein [Opitutus sp. WL0086]WRQ89860.1 hypothetical protein K1X11_010625 [Opitutus sp. WL0086]